MSDAFQTTEATVTDTEVKFEDLVGEGKKYRDQAAAAKAIVEKDRYIARLEQEAKERNEALAKRENEQQFLDRMEQIARAKSPEAVTTPKDGTETAAAMKPEDVERIIAEREDATKRKTNLDTVLGKLQELYGDDYKRHVSKVAQTVKMSTADLTDLASRNPEAFYRIVGVNQNQTAPKRSDAFDAPPRSATATPLAPPNANVKNYEYFKKIRAEKGEAAYFNPTVQMEMWNALKEMGEDTFYGRT